MASEAPHKIELSEKETIELPVEESSHYSSYQKWLAIGEKAQSEKKWIEAIRSYHIALSYQKNEELEKRLDFLEKKLEQEIKDKIEILEKAELYEKLEEYSKALNIYKKIYEQKPSKEIQTKLEFCRQILLGEEKTEHLLTKIEESLCSGEWKKAISLYNNFLQYSFLAAYSQRLQRKLEDARESLLQLESSGKQIFLWLEEKRTAKAILFLKKQNPCFAQEKLLKTFQKYLFQDMVEIPSGIFWMGGDTEDDEYPLHQVNIKTYFLDRFETTQLAYSYFIHSTGYEKPEKWMSAVVPPEEEKLPVEGVSWEDARTYAEWAGKRLPSEAEWEKAARGTDGHLYPWGNEFHSSFCNSMESGIRARTPVGNFSKGISPYGCFDMAGNVLEWTEDTYKRYPGGKAPLFPRQGYRVARGGSWYYKKDALRCSNRYPLLQSVRLEAVGFRCAFSMDE